MKTIPLRNDDMCLIEVTNPVTEIVEKALALSKKKNEKVKIFVAGRFHPLADKILSPITFSRSGLHVHLDEKLDSAENEGKQLSFLGDYSQCKYLKKKERGAEKKDESAFKGIGEGSNPDNWDNDSHTGDAGMDG